MTSLKKLALIFSLAITIAIGANLGAVAQDGDYKDESKKEWTPPGPAKEFSQIAFLLGKWDVAIDIDNEHQPKKHYKAQSQVIELFDGIAFEENFLLEADDHVMKMKTLFTFDRQKKVFRIARLDSSMGMLDVMEGNFNDVGTLILTNRNSGTAMKNYEGDGLVYSRLTLNKLSESKFEIAWEMSKDEGKTWKGVGNMTYTRAA